MNPVRVMVAIAMALPAANAQTNSLAAGVSVPAGEFAASASTGFGLALLSRSDATIGPFDIRVDLTFDRLNGTGSIIRYSYTSGGLAFVRDLGLGTYVLVGFGGYQASDQGGTINGVRVGTNNHTNGGAKAGAGVEFSVLGRPMFIEANLIRLLSAPAVSWVPVRFGLRL